MMILQIVLDKGKICTNQILFYFIFHDKDNFRVQKNLKFDKFKNKGI